MSAEAASESARVTYNLQYLFACFSHLPFSALTKKQITGNNPEVAQCTDANMNLHTYKPVWLATGCWLLAGGEDHQAAKQEQLTLLARLHWNVIIVFCRELMFYLCLLLIVVQHNGVLTRI